MLIENGTREATAEVEIPVDEPCLTVAVLDYGATRQVDIRFNQRVNAGDLEHARSVHVPGHSAGPVRTVELDADLFMLVDSLIEVQERYLYIVE